MKSEENREQRRRIISLSLPLPPSSFLFTYLFPSSLLPSLYCFDSHQSHKQSGSFVEHAEDDEGKARGIYHFGKMWSMEFIGEGRGMYRERERERERERRGKVCVISAREKVENGRERERKMQRTRVRKKRGS